MTAHTNLNVAKQNHVGNSIFAGAWGESSTESSRILQPMEWDEIISQCFESPCQNFDSCGTQRAMRSAAWRICGSEGTVFNLRQLLRLVLRLFRQSSGETESETCCYDKQKMKKREDLYFLVASLCTLWLSSHVWALPRLRFVENGKQLLAIDSVGNNNTAESTSAPVSEASFLALKRHLLMALSTWAYMKVVKGFLVSSCFGPIVSRRL